MTDGSPSPVRTALDDAVNQFLATVEAVVPRSGDRPALSTADAHQGIASRSAAAAATGPDDLVPWVGEVVGPHSTAWP